MNIAKEALLERGFIAIRIEDGICLTRRNSIWNFSLQVVIYDNGSSVVQMEKYGTVIEAFGCRTIEQLDSLINMFLG